MPTTYTSLLGFALPATGELSGTWGDTVNDYITKYVDASVAGAQTISGSQTAVTLSTTTGATLSQAGTGATGSAQYAIINCTGNPASMLTVTAPATSKAYIVINATSTSQDVKVVGSGPTTGVTMVSGEKAIIAWNGSDFVKVASTVITNLTGTLGIANGGTGQTTASAAFNALSPITSTGDLILGNGSNSATRLAIGANTYVLTSNGTTASWAAPATGVASFSAGTTGFTPSTATTGAITLAGTLAVANGGTGQTTYTDGQLLIGNTTGNTLTKATLTAGSGVSITNGSGSITIASTSAAGYSKGRLFLSSGTFVAPFTGNYTVTVVGAGGSGGAARTTTPVNATGGGAGAMVIKTLTLTGGVSYTVTCGAGGTAVTRSTAGATAGNAGGSSSFSGSGITTITANGGGAGNATAGGSAAASSGGTASGGDININGGGGGACTGTVSARNASGGGAVGWLGTGYSSGAVSSSTAGASGGAGVGGKSGDCTSATAVSGGGGSGAASTDNSTAGGVAASPTIDNFVPSLLIVVNGVGGVSNASGQGAAPTAGQATGPAATTAGAGGGSGIAANVTGGAGAFFGGGAATSSTAGSTAGAGGRGAGGGGAVTSGTSNAVSGAGGDGFVIVEW